MRKSFLLLPLLCLSLLAAAQFKDTGLYAALDEGERASRMREHVAQLSAAALEGRGAGTQGEREAAEYMTEALQACGVEILSGAFGEPFGIRQADGDTLCSRNVIGIIPGYDRQLKDRYIVIGARLDNLGTRQVTVDGRPHTQVFYGANGNASGLAMLLELSRMLVTNAVLLKRTVVVAAFGASRCDQAGVWYFLNRRFEGASRIDAMLNLDAVGTLSRGFYAYTASNADLNALLVRLAGTLQPVQPDIVSREPFVSDHRAFYAREIPSVLFTTGLYPEYNSEKDTPSVVEYGDMERELEYVYHYAVELACGQAPRFNPVTDVKPRRRQEGVVAYQDCDAKPSFLGSTDPGIFLSKWVYVYLKYPQEAVREGIQGRVLVDFVIDEKGRVADVRVARGVHPLLDAEAVRVIAASPDWKPGRLRGAKVRTELTVEVEFRLERRKK
ncbi:MAG: TonB family protein [Bacteroidales bacterium]|nr:TonB family protein [Bacteroidales bacterium]